MNHQTTPSTNITIHQLNVNSLISLKKRTDLSVYLNRHKPDIVLINESKLNPTHRVQFSGYNFVRNDRPNSTRGGGTAILVKRPIQFTALSPALKLEGMESTIIKIILSNQKSVVVVSAYVARNSGTNSLKSNDLNKLNSLANNQTQLIIGGDFNARHQAWNDILANPNGNTLYDWYTNTNSSLILKAPLHPSRHGTDTHSYLDLFLVSSTLSIINEPGYGTLLKTLPFESDHDAVVLKIHTLGRMPVEKKITINNFGNVNWKIFNQKIDTGIENIDLRTNENMSNVELDSTIDKITDLFGETIDTTVPKIEVNPDTQIPLPGNILDIIKYKNNLRRRLHGRHYNQNNYTLKSQIKCLNVMINRQIINFRTNYINTKLQNIHPDKNLFRNIKRFSSYKIRDQFPSILSTSSNTNQNQDYVTPLEKANALGQYFSGIHKQNLNLGDNSFTTNINNTIKTQFSNFSPLIQFTADKSADQTMTKFHPLPDGDPNNRHLNFISPEHLNSIIKRKNNKKSFGFDGIPNFVIKKLSYKFIKFLAILFNQLFNNAHFPTAWKKAIIFPLLKPGKDPTKIESYRPISLLSCLSKLYESFLHEKILEHCNDNDLIPDEQFGFRPFHSTNHALLNLLHDVSTSLNDRSPTICVAIDNEKAFDTVWIEGLIYKMSSIHKFHLHICRIIYNYLINRNFQISIENILSLIFWAMAGVPQGAILAPLLYIIYTIDMPAPDTTDTVTKIKRTFYADDTLVYASGKHIPLLQDKVNRYLKLLHSYMDKWKIKINTHKCEVLTIYGNANSIPRRTKRELKDLTIKINNTTLPNKKNMKYLGVILSHNFKHYEHIRNIIKKTTRAFHAVKGIMYNRQGLSIKTKSIIYKQLLRPILSYAFPIWSDISSAQMEKLRLLERKYLRIITGIRRKPNSRHFHNNNTLYQKSNVERIDRYLTKLAESFHKKLPFIPNNLITQKLQSQTNQPMKFNSPLHFGHLLRTGNMYDCRGNLIHYHQRYRGQGLVYNVKQNI